MNKAIIKAALLAWFMAVSGCSTYNAYAPDWAKIGASGTEAEATSDATENESKWWNPFSW